MALSRKKISDLKDQHPDFKGTWEHLARFMQVANSPRRTDLRRDALAEWESYNTQKKDWSVDSRGHTKKTTLTESYRRVQLAGADLGYLIVGPIDLREANLRQARLEGATFTNANLAGADLRGADLERAFLRGVDFSGARLEGANLRDAILADANLSDAQFDEESCLTDADLQGTNFSGAVLSGTSMRGANLQLAQLIRTDLRGADLSNCMVFGVAAWEPVVDEYTKQTNLLVSPKEPPKHVAKYRHAALHLVEDVPELHTDSLEHAHLIHLMTNPDLYRLLTNVNKKGVLLLGRFSGTPGKILDALRISLREQGYLPLKFDFRRPDQRTLKETILTLAGLCRFIVVDLTDAKSVPFELGTIVRDYKIPIVPIQQSGRETFSMYESIDNECRDRVLPALEYKGRGDLIAVVKAAIIDPAEKMAAAFDNQKQENRKVRRTSDFTD